MTRSCPSCGSTYPDESFFCGSDGSIIVQDQDPADFDPRLGKRLGGHVLVARVADGAMGRVYEARQVDTKARVAVKVLHDQVARDRVAVERFKREFETAHEMDSPYIVHVLEFGETPDASHYLTMEYLAGQELSKFTAQHQPLALARCVRTVCQIALALEHAHSYGFIHRDLKPDNIFLCDTPNGTQVRILDFGSVKLQVETGAKLTALGTTLGSPYYMSPEQATGASDVDQRSDVFALGAILYEMLTGKIAFDAPSVALILMKILNQSPQPVSKLNPRYGAALDAVIERALCKDKQARYGSARELADGLIAACGLTGSVESWAERAEPEIELALSAAANATPPRAAAMNAVPAAKAAGAAAQPPLAADQAPSPLAAGATRPSSPSEVPLRIPTRAPKAKWIVSIALGVALLCVVVFLMR